MIKRFEVRKSFSGIVVCDECIIEENKVVELKTHKAKLRYTPKKNQPYIRITQSFIPRCQITIRLDKLINNKMEVNV